MDTGPTPDRFALSRWRLLAGAVAPSRIGEIARIYDAATQPLRRAGSPPDAGGLIAVAERDDPAQLCRTEFLCGGVPAIAAFVDACITPLVEAAVGEPVALFKDKCNEKNPGGGAFPPHQDMAAYKHFPPRNFFTAMVPLDPATPENGCLAVADNLSDWAERMPGAVAEWIGENPLLHYHQGGPDNGAIEAAAAAGLVFAPVAMRPGDVLVFDAFVPHRSEVNRSDARRRALFLTYNAAREGRHYDRYYALKRSDAGNPIFHVATPTTADR